MTKTWIKMGFKIIKLLIIIIFIVVCVDSTISDKFIMKTENFNLNKTLDMNAMAEKEFEDINDDIYAAKDTYVGDLTGYSADCPLCTGKLGCLSSYNVYKNGVITYPDKVYGDVRIVASSKSLACGSVIRFKSNRVSSEETYAIVLDRGVRGRDIDILVPTGEYATEYIGRSTITYDVVRFGW